MVLSRGVVLILWIKGRRPVGYTFLVSKPSIANYPAFSILSPCYPNKTTAGYKIKGWPSTFFMQGTGTLLASLTRLSIPDLFSHQLSPWSLQHCCKLPSLKALMCVDIVVQWQMLYFLVKLVAPDETFQVLHWQLNSRFSTCLLALPLLTTRWPWKTQTKSMIKHLMTCNVHDSTREQCYYSTASMTNTFVPRLWTVNPIIYWSD